MRARDVISGAGLSALVEIVQVERIDEVPEHPKLIGARPEWGMGTGAFAAVSLGRMFGIAAAMRVSRAAPPVHTLAQVRDAEAMA